MLFIIKVCKVESEGHFNSSQFISSICKSQEDYFSWFTKIKRKRNATSCPNRDAAKLPKQILQTEPNKQQYGKQQTTKLSKQEASKTVQT